MQQIQINEPTAALRRVPVVLVDDTDGKTGETGITLTAGDLKLSKNGAAEVNHAGSLVEQAGGDYYYEATVGEVDTAGFLRGRLTKAGCRTFRFAVQIVGYDPNAVPADVDDIAEAVADQADIAQGMADAGEAKTAAQAAKTASEDLQTRTPDELSSDGFMKSSIEGVKDEPLGVAKPYDTV